MVMNVRRRRFFKHIRNLVAYQFDQIDDCHFPEGAKRKHLAEICVYDHLLVSPNGVYINDRGFHKRLTEEYENAEDTLWSFEQALSNIFDNVNYI